MTMRLIAARLGTVALLGSLAAGSSGCGFILTQAPPAGHENMNSFTCTESNTGPILDLVLGGLELVGSVALAASPRSGYYSYYQDAGTTLAVGAAWTAVFGASGLVGLHKTDQCRAAMRQLAARQAQGRPGPAGGVLAAGAVQTVIVRPAADTLVVGGQVQLMATAYGPSLAVIADKVFTWSSSNDAIASVSATGLVVAHATGSVVVAARADNVVGITTLLVVPSR